MNYTIIHNRSNTFPNITKLILKLGKDKITNEILRLRVHLDNQQNIDIQAIPCGWRLKDHEVTLALLDLKGTERDLHYWRRARYTSL